MSEAQGSAARRTQGEWGVSVLSNGRGAMVVTPPPDDMWRRVREGDLPVTSRRVALCESSHYVPHDAAVANARLIVRAVNAHAALVEASETYLSCDPEIDYWEDIVESHHNCGCDWCARAARVLAARKALRAALALAKGDAP